MYLVACFLVWGKKDPPTPLHLDVCTIHRLTNQSVTWLIDCYSWVGVNDPNRSCTQMPSIFTGLRNYQCQNQFIIHFTHRSGGRVKILNLSWIQSVCRFPVSPVAAYFLQLFFHMSSLLDRLKVWIGIVRFFSLLNIKQSPNLGYKKKLLHVSCREILRTQEQSTVWNTVQISPDSYMYKPSIEEYKK